MNMNYGGHRRAPIIVAARPGEAVEIAEYQDAGGERMLCNAGFTPHAITDGKMLQPMGNRTQEISSREMQRLLHVGTCHACNTRMMASANAADQIEIASADGVADIHCIMCSASVRPSIDVAALSRELAMEVAADDDGDEDDDAVGTYDDMDGDDDDGSSGDPDANDDDSDDSFYADDDASTDGADADDTTASDDDSDDDGDDSDDEIDEADMMVMPEVPMDASDMISDPGDPEGDGVGMGNDFDAAVASVTADILSMGRNHPLLATAADDEDDDSDGDEDDSDKDDSDNDDSGDDGDDDSDGSDDDGEDDGDDEVASAEHRVHAATRRLHRILSTAGTESMDMNGMDANDGMDEADMAVMPGVPMDASDMVSDPGDPEGDGVGMGNDRTSAVASARAELAEARLDLELALDRAEQPIAGRAREHAEVRGMHEGMRGRLRQARGMRTDGNAPMKSTMAKAGVDDDMMLDDEMMGDDIQPDTPGTRDDVDEIASLRTVDWQRARVSVASVDGRRWVFADGRPVAEMVRERATAAVRAQWDAPHIEKAFLAVASRGLPESEAREFGLRGTTLRISGNDAVRSAMRNSRQLAEARAERAIEDDRETARQCLATAFVGIMKGSFGDAKNDLRDVLVRRLTQAGVMEPRALVDAAVASAAEDTLRTVFAKASELAAKPIAARNEVASFVRAASFHSAAVDDGSALAHRLAQGATAAVHAAAGTAPQVEQAAAAPTRTSVLAQHLARIGGLG